MRHRVINPFVDKGESFLFPMSAFSISAREFIFLLYFISDIFLIISFLSLQENLGEKSMEVQQFLVTE